MGLIPGSGRCPGRGHGNPLQYSCLENPMDGGVWWATFHRVEKSQTHWSDWAHSTGTPGDATHSTWFLPPYNPSSYIRPAPGPGTLSAPNLTQYVSQWKGSTGTTRVVLWPLYTGSNLQDIQPKPISPFPPSRSFALSPKPVFQVHGNDHICKQWGHLLSQKSTSLHLPEFAPLCWLIKRVTKDHLFPETESTEQMQPLKNIFSLFLVRTRNKTGWWFNIIAKNRTQLAGYIPVCKDLLGCRPRPNKMPPQERQEREGKNVAVSLHLFHASKWIQSNWFIAVKEKYISPRPLPVPAASPNKSQRIQDEQGKPSPTELCSLFLQKENLSIFWNGQELVHLTESL